MSNSSRGARPAHGRKLGRLLYRWGLAAAGMLSGVAIGAGLVVAAAVRLVSRQPPPTEGPGQLSAPRRRFLKLSGFTLGGLAGAATAVPLVGWIFPHINPPDDEWSDGGPLNDYPEHYTRMAIVHNRLLPPFSSPTDRAPVYVKRGAGDEFTVFSVHCSHLGCPLSWFKESGLFMCPCHGGVFHADGSYAAGPPPRDMYRLAYRIRAGRLEVKLGHFPLNFWPGSGEAGNE